jgi:hypothetical protein
MVAIVARGSECGKGLMRWGGGGRCGKQVASGEWQKGDTKRSAGNRQRIAPGRPRARRAAACETLAGRGNPAPTATN